MRRFVFVLALGSAAAVTRAASIPVTNFSFENPALPNGDYQGDGNFPYPVVVPGWTQDPNIGSPTFSGFDAGVQNFIGTGAYGNGATLDGTADGKQALYINGNDVYQDVGALLANTTYTLTVAAGNQPGYGTGSVGDIALVNGTNASGTTLSSAALGPNNDPNHPLAIGNFTDFTTSFTTGASVSGDLTIVLAKTSGNQIDFDNVRLTAVPEPASLGLLGLGAVGLVARRRRHGC